MELTNELKVERIRLQLTAKSVAEMMGISRQQLSNIEQSDNLPVMVKYIAFLRSRGVDLNDLFDRIPSFNFKPMRSLISALFLCWLYLPVITNSI